MSTNGNEDAAPLMNGAKSSLNQNKPANPNVSPAGLFRHSLPRFILIVILLAFLGVFLFVEEDTGVEDTEAQDVKRSIPLNQCPAFCNARRQQLKKHFGGDLMDYNFLLLSVEKERNKFHERMKVDYGEEAFKSMWVNSKNGQVIGDRVVFSADTNSDVSYNKFKRKLQLKVLRMQLNLVEEMRNLKGCDCTKSESSPQISRRRLETQTVVLPEIPSHYERFVWSTGGHSAAAGHGNLYNESYTAFLERGIRNVFTSIGMDFVGRNYAMGGMDSAPNLALCNEAVYGTDADVISWDFGMTDGGAHWKTTLFANRAGVHVNRPAHVSINMAGRNYKSRVNALKVAEQDGVPTLHLVPSYEDQVVKGAPDVFGMPQDKVDKIGEYARYYKCKGAIEKEQPCQERKYNENICPERKFKASWHPGWRQMALTGNLLALFLAETMIEATKDIIKDLGSEEPQQLYNKLKEEEDKEYEAFKTTRVPDDYPDFVSPALVAAGLKTEFLFRNKAICKTSLLPAQTRFLGILTKSDLVGELHGYDVGVEAGFATKNPPINAKDKGELTLVFHPEDRQKCEVDLNMDYKDYYCATEDWGWASLTFPNDAEIAAYASDGFHPTGVVVLCFMKCDWGKCPKGDLQADAIKEGKFKMTLNGQPVEDLERIDQCHVVKSKNGYIHQPNENGRYELKILVEKQADASPSYVRITSVVVL
jgi:hypothetical protein